MIKYSLPCSIHYQVWSNQSPEISHHKILGLFQMLAPQQKCKYKQIPVKYTQKEKRKKSNAKVMQPWVQQICIKCL